MFKIVKFLLALGIALGTITIAQALSNVYYMPVIYQAPTPTITFTPTITPTPTNTPTPTITPTPTKTPTPAPGVDIVDILYDPDTDPLAEYVEIKNTKSSAVDMTDWFIKAETGQKYIFPSFKLKAGKRVKVWSGVGTDTSTNLYWGSSEPIWKDNHSCAYLKDDERKLHSTYCY